MTRRFQRWLHLLDTPPSSTPSALSDPSAPAPTTQNAALEEADGVVRVFVSSTFRDMQVERDILVKTVFPELRARMRARGVELFEVDLRWGVTEEQAQQGETLPILFSEVDRCRPFFIGLLGERYGWVPDAAAFTDALRADFPALADLAGRSVTEMEILYGALRAEAAPDTALFFIRDPALTATQAPAEDFVETDAAIKAQLEDLKARVLRSGARVVTYASMDAFAETASEALGAVLEARFPEAVAPDPFTQTQRLHEAYARERRGLYVGAGPYLGALDAWSAEAAPPPLLVTGASGGGKSALIANWVQAWRAAHPDGFVFEHYLAASPDSADPLSLLRRLLESLDRWRGAEAASPPGDADLAALADMLEARLAASAAAADRSGAPVLIALDGLDALSEAQELLWLPTAAPFVRLVASSLPGSAAEAALGRGWRALEVMSLSAADGRALLVDALERWGRSLSDRHLEPILNHPLAGLPLFLRTVLDELRASAVHDQLSDRLAHYLAAADMPDLFLRMLVRLEEEGDVTESVRMLSIIWASRAGLEESEVLGISGVPPLAWARMRNGLGDGLRVQAGRIVFSHAYLRDAVAARYLPTEAHLSSARAALARRFADREPDARLAEELPFQLRALEDWESLEAYLTSLDVFSLQRGRGDADLLSFWLALRVEGRDPEALLCGEFAARAGAPETWSAEDADLAHSIGEFLHFAGAQGDAAEQLAEQVVAACARLFGSDHAATLLTRGSLAQTLKARGAFARAQAEEEQVLAARTRLFGADDPATLQMMHSLAGTLSARGDLEEAGRLQERVLEGHERLLGERHPDTLAALNNLAHTRLATGDLEGAQTLQERVAESAARALGPDHPNTLTSLEGLAQTRHQRGDHAGARALVTQVLEARRRIFGAEHPAALISANNFGAILLGDGAYAEAQALQEGTLATSTRVLGAEHPETLKAMNNLAATLRAVGDFQGARTMMEQAYEGRARIFGHDHPETLTSLGNLAQAMQDLGDLNKAQALQEQALAGELRLFGPDHPAVLITLSNLALTLFNRGNFEEAQERQEQVLEARGRLLGERHPATLAAMSNLASTLAAQGELEAAEKLLSGVVVEESRTLGAEHPSTLLSRINRAYVAAGLGDYAEAVADLEQVSAASKRVLGEEHPTTLLAGENLAHTRAASAQAGTRGRRSDGGA